MNEPNIPTLSSKVPVEIKRAFDAIRDFFRKSGPFVAEQTLQAAGVINASGTVPGFGVTPPQPEGLTVTGGFNKIFLEWDASGWPYLAYTEVYRAETNNIGVAAKIGTTQSGTMYVDDPPDSSLAKTYYYWIRFVSTSNKVGPFNQTAGTAGSTANDPVYVMEILAAELDNVTPTTGVPDLVYAVNRFAIKNVTAGVTKYPFIVDATLGVIMDVALIKDATITNAKIASLATDKLTAGSALIGSALIADLDVGKLTGTTITGKTIQTAASGKRFVVDQTTNKAHFYGDRGDGTIEELLVLGTTSVGNTLVVAGNANMTTSLAYYGVTKSLLECAYFQNNHTTSGTGVLGRSDAGSGGTGVWGQGSAWDFYAAGGGTNYGPFTGAHDGVVPIDFPGVTGDIVVDGPVIAKRNVSNCLFMTELSTQPQQAALGVLVETQPQFSNHVPSALVGSEILLYELDQAGYTRCSVNALGEGQVNVCREGGSILAGDYICTSSRTGKGMKQADDLMHNYTVAKAREDCIWLEGEDDVRMIACTYHCG